MRLKGPIAFWDLTRVDIRKDQVHVRDLGAARCASPPTFRYGSVPCRSNVRRRTVDCNRPVLNSFRSSTRYDNKDKCDQRRRLGASQGRKPRARAASKERARAHPRALRARRHRSEGDPLPAERRDRPRLLSAFGHGIDGSQQSQRCDGRGWHCRQRGHGRPAGLLRREEQPDRGALAGFRRGFAHEGEGFRAGARATEASSAACCSASARR